MKTIKVIIDKKEIKILLSKKEICTDKKINTETDP